jgi:hypothetical protein
MNTVTDRFRFMTDGQLKHRLDKERMINKSLKSQLKASDEKIATIENEFERRMKTTS